MTKMRIAALPGDGIGPDVTDVAIRVLEAVAEVAGHEVETEAYLVGWSAVRETGDPLPEETIAACLESDAVFLGAVGSPEADDEPHERRPETGLLRLRKRLGCFANLRPARVSPALVDTSPVRREIVEGTDFMVVRELAGGLYYGEPRREGTSGGSGGDGDSGGTPAVNTLVYGADEIERIARMGFETARARAAARGDGGAPRLTSVDKANVLEVSRLWRRVVEDVGSEYPEVELDHMLVDRAAMELVLRPTRFDVLLTGNLFGDILSDEAAAVVGSLGILPSASLGGVTDLYEPVHGSAPEIAGKDIANPMAAIGSISLLLRHTFGLHEEADAVDAAVESLLAAGRRTADLAAPGEETIGTRAFGDEVIEIVRSADAPLQSTHGAT